MIHYDDVISNLENNRYLHLEVSQSYNVVFTRSARGIILALIRYKPIVGPSATFVARMKEVKKHGDYSNIEYYAEHRPKRFVHYFDNFLMEEML